MQNAITIETNINASIEKVWQCWTKPEHIMQWNHAGDDWHCPASSYSLEVGGKFSATMAAKDGSFSFDFWGIHDEVILNKLIASTMGDGRKMKVEFIAENNSTKVIETFEPENENPIEMQQMGWQMILDNFKKHVEQQ
ncbi:MAG: hypothetical protein RL065_2298 [Bacteroidota bacterium]|jgi:uncharacterized protein YndB with AHSA1/START domain